MSSVIYEKLQRKVLKIIFFKFLKFVFVFKRDNFSLNFLI